MSAAIDEFRAIRGRRLAAVALPLVAALVAIAIALPPPPREAGDVCALGMQVARESMEWLRGAGGEDGTKGALTRADIVAVLDLVDWDLVADQVPPELGDAVELAQGYVTRLLTATDAGDPVPKLTSADTAALQAITDWFTESCS